MEELRIDTGGVKLKVNGDPTRVIAFNPTDISFAERFYSLLSEFEEKEKEYQQKVEALQKNTELDPTFRQRPAAR